MLHASEGHHDERGCTYIILHCLGFNFPSGNKTSCINFDCCLSCIILVVEYGNEFFNYMVEGERDS
jgi:hypothetical protein